jgi:hypothetical protein
MPAETRKSSLVNNFLDLLGTSWSYNLSLKTQWAIIIQPESNDKLFSVIKDYTDIDINGFYVDPQIQKKLLGEKTQPNIEGLGLYFAQSVKMPKETLTVAGMGVDGMGGYLKGIVAGDRLDMQGRHLNIDFLETNLDFTEGLIRPWIITASYKGLIATKDDSIKATIIINEYTRQSSKSDKPLRIEHTFTGCVPIDLQEKTLKYDTEDVSTNSVSWVYNHYTYKVDPTFQSYNF